MLHLPLAFLFLSAAFVAGSSLSKQRVETCDVIIAGGSLASLAAAVAAANYSSTLNVCFLEPTDWPGGQLTASSVPAIDFGPFNRKPANIAQPFASFLFGQFMPDKVNPGHCWVTQPLNATPKLSKTPPTLNLNFQVSTKCFLPLVANEHFVNPLLSSFPNLKTYLMTSIIATHSKGSTITGVTAVQRVPRGSNSGWETLTSR